MSNSDVCSPSSLRAERSDPAFNASGPWIASSLTLLAMTSNLVLATRFAPELLFKPTKLSLSAPIFVR